MLGDVVILHAHDPTHPYLYNCSGQTSHISAAYTSIWLSLDVYISICLWRC
jgi:hypothetical protein